MMNSVAAVTPLLSVAVCLFCDVVSFRGREKKMVAPIQTQPRARLPSVLAQN